MNTFLRFFSIFFVRGVGAVAVLVVNLFVLKLESVELAGVFFVVYTFFQIGLVLSRFGADIYLVREYYQLGTDREVSYFFNRIVASSAIVGSCLVPFSVLLGCVFLSGWGGAGFVGGDEQYWLLTILLWLPFVSSMSIIFYVYQARHQVSIYILGINVLQPWFFLIFYLLVRFFFDGEGWVSSNALSVSFGLSVLAYGAVSIFFVIRSGLRFCVRDFLRADIFVFLWGRRKYALGTVAGQAVGWLPYFLSSFLLGPGFASVFNLVQRFAMLMSFISVSVNGVAAPRFAQMSSVGDFSGIKRLFLYNSKVLFFCATIFVVFALGLLMVFPVFSGEYFYAICIVLVGYWVNCSTSVCGYYFQNASSVFPLNLSLCLVAFLSLPLTLLLLDLLGVNGAALSMLVVVGGVNLVLFPWALIDLRRRTLSVCGGG